MTDEYQTEQEFNQFFMQMMRKRTGESKRAIETKLRIGQAMCPGLMEKIVKTPLADDKSGLFGLVFTDGETPRAASEQHAIADCYLERLKDYPYTTLYQVIKFRSSGEWEHTYKYTTLDEIYARLVDRFDEMDKDAKSADQQVIDIQGFLLLHLQDIGALHMMMLIDDFQHTSPDVLKSLDMNPAHLHPESWLLCYAMAQCQIYMHLCEHEALLIEVDLDGSVDGYDDPDDLDMMLHDTRASKKEARENMLISAQRLLIC